MTSELLVVIGTLISAIVAGAISYIAGRGIKTYEWRLSLAREEIASRKSLYVAFLAEAHRLLFKSTEKKISSAFELKDLDAKYVEISILSSPPVAEAAKFIVDSILTANTKGTEKPEKDFYARKEIFINAVRCELASYEKPN